ncbi:retrovirus-related Pol polyprotein from transposon 412 [Trichonephila clavipes]|nr:retrovirus-related Pol polyprotein from transposon 412 [Trichonephila clavipes]
MKTLQIVCERFYWNNVWSDVEKCCHTCDPCAARKGPRKRTRGKLQLYNVGAPFERIAFDILGPLLRSSDDNNILVVMDYITKWPKAYPIPDQEASTDAEIPADILFSRPLDAPLAPKEYIEQLHTRMEEMHHLARERISMTSEKMKARYDARATRHDFNKVWLWNLKRRKGLFSKLQTNWKDPYTVLKRRCGANTEITTLKTEGNTLQ